MSKVSLMIIDTQRSFCSPNGELFVPGADEDCVRLSAMINRLENRIDSIHVTLDSHQEVDIAHPVFWRDSDGNPPNPFTIITRDDVEKGRYVTSNPASLKRAVEYVQELDNNNRYPLCIWPPHCIIGSEGYQIESNVSDAIRQWGRNRFKMIDFVTKGSNPWTEHYSAIKADVPDPSDPTTLVNSRFVNTVDEADLILVSGQALSHCVASTVRDLASEFGEESIKKLILLRDTCSNVPGFEQNGVDFLNDLQALGMRVESSTTVLS
jgi:nicotinamidase-related amidase